MSRLIAYLHVHAISLSSQRGLIRLGSLVFPCSLGRAGRIHRKREGDGGTPAGCFALRRIFYRQDRLFPPRGTALPLRPRDGWCETVGDRNYNRLVAMPYAASHETMMRADGLYDIVVELSHNEMPRVRGHGSAVFFHLGRPDLGPTAGCIAVSLRDMKIILGMTRKNASIVIWSSNGPANPLRRKQPNQPGR